MSDNAFLVVSRPVLRSSTWNGPNRLRGSEPRKKFRQTLISGTTARSWYTVAIPRSSASRGEVNLTGSPSTLNSPVSCWCTPARILIKVDFPAPLSPSTQVTSPALTTVDTSRSAMTLP